MESILYEKATVENLKTFELKSLDSYTDGLVDVAAELTRFAPCCVLVPMRGGIKPCEFLDAMLNRRIPLSVLLTPIIRIQISLAPTKEI